MKPARYPQVYFFAWRLWATTSSAEAVISVPKKILVVDDNADSAESMAVVLGLDGHTVEIAVDGPSALHTARRFAPDVVLMDIGLPGMDGFEVALHLRAEPSMQATTLIALSGYGGEEHRARARKSGFDHYLEKPVAHRALQRLIAQEPT